MQSQTQLLHTDIGRLPDDHVLELVGELAEAREGRFAHSPGIRFLDFLTLFFLPEDQTKFIPIKSGELIMCRLLTSKVDHLNETPIRAVVHELVPLAKSHPDNHGHQKLYVALNALMRPICQSLKKQKNRKKPRGYW